MSDKHQNTAAWNDSLSGQVDGVCDRFETAWKSGSRPRLEEFLPGLSEPAANQAFRELLEVELAYRLRSGEAPAADEYRDRFPQHLAAIAEAFSAAASQPRRLGDYEVLEIIGSGGMGVVYKARHVRLDRLVALKVLPERLLSNDQLLARFHKEMQSIGRLNHPNIVHAYDAREESGVHILVMELIDGLSLDKLLKAGPLGPADACELVRQAAGGLQHAHEHQLVHRDIKPSNLILNSSGVVQIVDFGLARINDERQTGGLTQSHSALGTLDYMAPEQFDDSAHVDIRADIYSLGCTLFNLLAGNPPYPPPQYSTLTAKMRAHCLLPAPKLHELRPEVPAALAGIVERMLAKQPADRFATPADVAKALAPFAVGNDLPKLLAVGQAVEANRPTAPSTDHKTTCPHVSSALSDTLPTAGRGGRKRANRVKLLAAAGAAAIVLAAIIVYIKNKNGEVVAKVEVPDGGSVTIQDKTNLGSAVMPKTIPLPANAIDLLKLADPALQPQGWRREGENLVGDGSGDTFSLPIPYAPPEEYDLELTVERLEGSGAFAVGMAAADRQFNVRFDMFYAASGKSQPWCSLSPPDGKSADNNETTRVGALFTNGRPNRIKCSVRHDGVDVSFDGASVISYKGSLSRLDRSSRLGFQNPRCVFLVADKSPFRIHEYRLIPARGTGELLKLSPPHDRETAEWAHQNGADLGLITSDGFVRVLASDQVPAEPFLICQLQFNRGADDADLARLFGLTYLDSLELNHATLTDAGLAQLEGLSLKRLRITGARDVTRAGINHFRWAVPECLVISDDDPHESVDRKAAEWVISAGGKCDVMIDHNNQRLSGVAKLAALPECQLILGAVNLSRCKFTDADLEHLRGLPSLQRIDLKRTLVADSALAVLAENKNLTFVQLDDCTNIADIGLQHLRGLRKLTELYLGGLPITDAGLGSLEELKQLRRLNLAATRITDAGLVHLEGLSSLELLYLGGNPGITNDGLKHLATLTSLRTLSLSGSAFSDAGVANLRNLTRLEELTVRNGRVSDATLKWAAGLPGLYRLDGINGELVSDEGLEALATSKSLRILGMSGLGRITGRGWAAIAGMQGLRELDLNLSGLTDAGLGAVVKQGKLQSLGLIETQVTDAGLGQLRGLPSLEHLQISPSLLTDTGVTNLGRLPALRTLQLMGDKATDAVFQRDWLERLPQLSKIITQNGKVSDACVERLKKVHPNLEIIRH